MFGIVMPCTRIAQECYKMFVCLVCMCESTRVSVYSVCVCVCVHETEREREKESGKYRDRELERQREGSVECAHATAVCHHRFFLSSNYYLNLLCAK